MCLEAAAGWPGGLPSTFHQYYLLVFISFIFLLHFSISLHCSILYISLCHIPPPHHTTSSLPPLPGGELRMSLLPLVWNEAIHSQLMTGKHHASLELSDAAQPMRCLLRGGTQPIRRYLHHFCYLQFFHQSYPCADSLFSIAREKEA